MAIEIDKHDQELVDRIFVAMKDAFEQAHSPSAVVKKFASRAMRFRNKGREAAKKRHPFKGVCEASGLPLQRCDAHLDELTSKGYAGDVRWVCPKANNSGSRSCGGC